MNDTYVEELKKEIDDLYDFLKEKGNPLHGFIFLFNGMIQLAKNFEHPPFKELIESFGKDAPHFKELAQGILDLEKTIFIDYPKEEE